VWKGTAFGRVGDRTDVPKLDWYMDKKIDIDSLITRSSGSTRRSI
jgi:Zn-dependent alcohol dehydrogenase